MVERNIDTGGVSVCLSHAGIDSKLITVGSCALHQLAAQ